MSKRAPDIAAIPMTYKSIRMRSMLEARWAIMFDELGLEWEYEPSIPLAGYIADFLVKIDVERAAHARPQHSPYVLCESKPIVVADDYAAPVAKIALSGWEHAAAVLCPTVWQVADGWAIGMGTERVERRDAGPDGHLAWRPIGISDDGKLRLGGGRDVRDLWRRAGNKVQWLPSTKGTP